MKLRNAFSPSVCKPVPAGRRLVPEYKLVFDENKKENVLVEIDKTDVYLATQSFANSCDITTRLAMYMNGDPNALNTNPGVYADLSGCPKSMVEARRMAVNADNVFNTLPAEFKEAFNNDFGTFKNAYVKGKSDAVYLNYMAQKEAKKNAKNDEKKVDNE